MLGFSFILDFLSVLKLKKKTLEIYNRIENFIKLRNIFLSVILRMYIIWKYVYKTGSMMSH